MKEQFILEYKNLEIMLKQIKNQKKTLLLFPFVYLLLLFTAFARNNGHMPEFYFYLITIPFLIIPYLYFPIVRGILMGKSIYKIELLNESTLRLTTFGTLWRPQKEITADYNDIKVREAPLSKLLFKKYLLNVLYVRDKKLYIFNKILVDSEIRLLQIEK